MKKLLFGIALTALLMSLSSCVSTTFNEPAGENDTLVVGRFQMTASGVRMDQGGAELKGNKKANCEITVLDLDTNKKLILRTDGEGIFMSTKFIPGHSYEILTFSYNKNYSTGNWSLVDCKVNYNPKIEIKEGCVNPWIDLVVTISPGDKPKSIRYHWTVFTQNQKHIAAAFREKYPESKWLSMPFANEQ